MCRFRSDEDADYMTLTMKLREAYQDRQTALGTTRLSEGMPKRELITTVHEVPQVSNNGTPKEGKIAMDKLSMGKIWKPDKRQIVGQITFPTYIPDDAHFTGREGLIRDIKPHLLSGIHGDTARHVGPHLLV